MGWLLLLIAQDACSEGEAAEERGITDVVPDTIDTLRQVPKEDQPFVLTVIVVLCATVVVVALALLLRRRKRS